MRTLITAAYLACMALTAHAQLDTSGNLAADWNLGGHTISNGVFVGDGGGLTGVITGVTIEGGSATTNAGVVALTVSGGGGVSSIPLNGNSALDWGVLNGTMERTITNGYSTIESANDIFAYTDALPIYSATGGTVSACYIGAWSDVALTNDFIQQTSIDNGSTWSNYTTVVTGITTTPTVFTMTNSPGLLSGRTLYRFAVATNDVSASIFFYMIDVRGQL